jgi:hypothetical protein
MGDKITDAMTLDAHCDQYEDHQRDDGDHRDAPNAARALDFRRLAPIYGAWNPRRRS